MSPMSPHAAPPQAFRFAQLSSGARIAWPRTEAPTAPTLVRVAHWLTSVACDLLSTLWLPWVEEPEAVLDAAAAASREPKVALLGASGAAAIAIAYAMRHPKSCAPAPRWTCARWPRW